MKIKLMNECRYNFMMPHMPTINCIDKIGTLAISVSLHIPKYVYFTFNAFLLLILLFKVWSHECCAFADRHVGEKEWFVNY